MSTFSAKQAKLDFKLKLVSIEVKNFKSFSAAANKDMLGHVIGPFTDFTGIIGPNGSGKSNIFDAIAFALNLSLAPGKIRHARDLSHRLKQVTLDEKENASDQDYEFFVKLNLIKTDLQGKKCEKLSIQRGLKKTEADADGQHSYFNEYIINDNDSRPLLFNEYKNILSSVYHLDIQEFAVYQNQLESLCFGEKSSQKLTEMFEKLSGSQEFKEKFELLKAEISHQEGLMKKASDQLKEQRHEKIKIKGLSDFQKQIDDCIREQKEIESILVGLSILQASTHCKEISKEQIDISESLSKSAEDRQLSLQSLKTVEAQLRKLDNTYADRQRQINRFREQLLQFKTNSIHKQQQIDNTKVLMEQKRILLQRVEQQNQVNISKKQNCEAIIKAAKIELKKIEKLTAESEELQAQGQQREEYFKIKSSIQVEDAQIEREKIKLEKTKAFWCQKRAVAMKDQEQIQKRLDHSTDSDQFKQNLKELQKQMKEKQKKLVEIKKDYNEAKENNKGAKEQIQSTESALLEKEFELKEVEMDKQIRTQDAKLMHILDELKKRCKGYLGQLYELMKPINKKYDVAVKVCLTKCLKFLVVDTVQSSRYVTDFLKEKGLMKEVLVLENIPQQFEKNKNQISQHKLKELGGEFVQDVIDVTRRNNNQVIRAVQYFVKDKIVCTDFDAVIRLQREAGCRNIVTLDGVEFKQGMISGGHSNQNIFNLNFGQYELDKDIKRLSDQIKGLDEKLQALRSTFKEHLTNESKLLRDLNKAELEIDSLMQQKLNLETSMKNQTENQKTYQTGLMETQKNLSLIDNNIEDVTKQIKQLHDDLQEIEAVAFKGFCKLVKTKNIQEYELKINGQADSQTSVFDKKCELEQTIQRYENDINIIDTNSSQQQVDQLKQSLQQEQENLKNLMNTSQDIAAISDPLGNLIEQASSVQKRQEELKELELEQQKLEKEKAQKTARSQKVRDELMRFGERQDGLLRNQIMNKMQLRNIQNQIKQKIEEAQLNMVLFLEDMGLNEEAVDEIQTQIMQDGYEEASYERKIVSFLIDKIDTVDTADDIEQISQIEDCNAQQKSKLIGLQKQEDEYNRNVQVVVESDEQQMKINQVITDLKKQIEEVSNKIQATQAEFVEVKNQRKERFIAHFDKVASQVSSIYGELTQSATNPQTKGHASLTLIDREQPYLLYDEGDELYGCKNIIYDFKPPNKQFDSDIQSRSGGEKTIAGIALIFALAQERIPQPPPMILLDEVDAHLDKENVELLSKFIKNWNIGNSGKPQILMISHKEQAVSKSDSLIGVTQQEYCIAPKGQTDDKNDLVIQNKHKYVTASTFSLDLRKYTE